MGTLACRLMHRPAASRETANSQRQKNLYAHANARKNGQAKTLFGEPGEPARAAHQTIELVEIEAVFFKPYPSSFDVICRTTACGCWFWFDGLGD